MTRHIPNNIILDINNDKDLPSSFWFRGGSWGIIYYSGVYKAIKKIYSKKQIANVKWGGVSAGAIISLLAALDMDPEECSIIYDKLAYLASNYGVFGKMSIYHDVFLRDLLPDNGSEWKKLKGKLFVGITKFPFTHELVSEWESNKDLRETLHASMHIPFYMSSIGRVKGCLAIDGDIIPNYVKIEENTVMVGTGDKKNFDIAPSIQISLADCFTPPSIKDYRKIELMGEKDTNTWFEKKPLTTRVALPTKKSNSKNFFYKPFHILCLLGWLFRYIEEYKKHFCNILLSLWTYKKIKHVFLQNKHSLL